ncbi:MAG: NAD(P)H-hydrate dehydratase [Gammaproteobacteria bacterium]|nr:MAG: NAD(P)H-hydrate dehydratase [Gammaproteobacteria bacterium]
MSSHPPSHAPRHPAGVLPAELYRAQQVRELDRIAIEELGIPGATLMERAGVAAFEALRRTWPAARRLSIVCGPGNNGGDGFVLARHAAAAGLQVRVGLQGDAARLRGDALGAHDHMRASGLEAQPYAADILDGADVIIDALFGTGLDRDVEGAWAACIEDMNASPAPVVAIDIPSGLHADSGRVLGGCVSAELSVSFIGLKQGMFTGEARNCCGRVLFDDLGVPPALYQRVPASARRADLASLGGILGKRPRSAHKGSFGHVLVIGGDSGFAGAARMAGEGAARSGAGLTSIATRAAHAGVLASQRPELMCHGIEDTESLAPLLQRATVVAVGPGLGRGAWGRQMLGAALAASQPLIMDADALNLLAESAPEKRRGAQPRIMTPHAGEAARLLACAAREVEADRFAAASAIAARYGAIVVLKGAGTLVCESAAATWVCEGGNPGMGSGGMGDVLTGIIAALVAQGLTPALAARAGVVVHAAAADRAAADGERGLLAGDLMQPLRMLVNTL